MTLGATRKLLACCIALVTVGGVLELAGGEIGGGLIGLGVAVYMLLLLLRTRHSSG